MTTNTTRRFAFTDRDLKALAPPAADGDAKSIEYSDTAVVGLKLAVTRQGSKVFQYRYKLHGGSRCIRIGSYPTIGLAEARQKALALRGAVERGTDPQIAQQRERAVPSFEDFAVQQYLPWAETAKRSVLSDESKLRNHLIPKIGRKRLADISTRDIQMHHAAIKASHCAATANRHLALLSAIFRKAVEWNVIDRNPCRDIKQFKEQTGKERFLSPDEIGRLYRAMEGEPNRVAVAALQLLLLTGVRLAEALQAKWADIDLGNQVWRLSKTKNGKVRHVVLTPEVVALFKAQPSLDRSPWVFQGRDEDKPIHNVRKTFERLLSKAGLERARIHDLRHTFASLAVNAGESLYTVQALLGHSSPTMTQRYAHLAKGTMRSASERVSAAIRQAAAGAQP